MIRRIVVFKMKASADGNDAIRNAGILAEMFNGLKTKLPFLIDIQAGVNINADSDHTMGLTVIYRDAADIDAYTNHSDHLVVKNFVGRVIETRTIVDFEI